MGEFIDMAAVLAPLERTRSGLEKLGATARCYPARSDRTLVVYDEATGDFAKVESLSRELGVAAFACHIHDGDLWLYEFYLNGVPTDRFNSLPEYWGDISLEEKADWKGDADMLARHWPGLDADSVRFYLCDQQEYFDEPDTKAYPEDEHAYNDCWQLTDFLRKLGTPYPSSLDES